MKVLVNIRSHVCFKHMFLYDSFSNHEIFNLAADAEVNSYIEDLPKSAVTASWLSSKIQKHLDNGMGTKKYYEAITDYLNKQKANAKNPNKPCNGGQGGSGSSNNSQSNNTPQNTPNSSSSPSDAAPDSTPKDDKPEEKPQPPSPSQEMQQPQEDKQWQQESSVKEEQESQYPDKFKEELVSLDSHDRWKDFKDVPEATRQLIENNINSVLKQTAEQVEKMRGTVPGEFKDIIEKLREKKPEVFNWKAYFRRMLGSIYDVNIRSTRRKVSKRFEGAAGIQHKKKVSILVAIDTSGSVSKKELQEFFSEIDYVYKAGARVTLLQCDTHITKIEEYDGKNVPEIKGRGGTNFNPPVNYYIKHRKEYASLIYFTDGDAPLPSKTPQGMVWVISSLGYHQDFPGKVIYIPKDN